MLFVLCVGIIDPVTVAGTGNSPSADRRARKEACLLLDTTRDLLHAPAVAPALLTPYVTASVGACHLPSESVFKCDLPRNKYICQNAVAIHQMFAVRLLILKISCVFVGQFNCPFHLLLFIWFLFDVMPSVH